jgi:hypothetical protein
MADGLQPYRAITGKFNSKKLYDPDVFKISKTDIQFLANTGLM